MQQMDIDTFLLFSPLNGCPVQVARVSSRVYNARHNCTTNNISQHDGDDRHVDEFSNTEISPVEHADWYQEEIGDGVLIA